MVSTSNSVNGKLQQRQEEMEELQAVRLLLAKLQGVFDLPRKLRAAIDRQAYEVAVEGYADAAPLLKKYGHKASAREAGQGFVDGEGEVERLTKGQARALLPQLAASHMLLPAFSLAGFPCPALPCRAPSSVWPQRWRHVPASWQPSCGAACWPRQTRRQSVSR